MFLCVGCKCNKLLVLFCFQKFVCGCCWFCGVFSSEFSRETEFYLSFVDCEKITKTNLMKLFCCFSFKVGLLAFFVKIREIAHKNKDFQKLLTIAKMKQCDRMSKAHELLLYNKKLKKFSSFFSNPLIQSFLANFFMTPASENLR